MRALVPASTRFVQVFDGWRTYLYIVLTPCLCKKTALRSYVAHKINANRYATPTAVSVDNALYEVGARARCAQHKNMPAHTLTSA
jgi:hypothetical protein